MALKETLVGALTRTLPSALTRRLILLTPPRWNSTRTPPTSRVGWSPGLCRVSVPCPAMLGMGSLLAFRTHGGPVPGVAGAPGVAATLPVGRTKGKHLCHDTSLVRVLWYCASGTIANRASNAHESPETTLGPTVPRPMRGVFPSARTREGGPVGRDHRGRITRIRRPLGPCGSATPVRGAGGAGSVVLWHGRNSG